MGRLRDLELKKAPSIAESVDWARTLVALEIGDLDERAVAETLGVVLKHASDQERAVKELRLAPMTSGLLTTHIAFLEALRGAGVPVSLAEDLDAIAAFSVLDWGDREAIRQGYAATLVKRQAQRPTFETLFDLYFPRLVGEGVSTGEDGSVVSTELDRRPSGPRGRALAARRRPGRRRPARRCGGWPPRRSGASGRCGGAGRACPAGRRTRPCSGSRPRPWSTRSWPHCSPSGRVDDEARRTADRRVGAFAGLVEADARRRIAAEKGPDHVARVAVRPSIDRLDFTSARQADLAEMRREIYPLARRLATRMARERHAQTPRPAGLPAYRPRLGLDRRRPADHASQAEATAPHRAGRALRRQRLGGELRAVHADARLRPARAVREGPRLHLRRPGARGDRRLPARRRPRAT